MKRLGCKNAAIILGLTANGLGVLRSLGKKGVSCVGIYHEKFNEVGCFSRYLKYSVKIVANWQDPFLVDILCDLAGRVNSAQIVLVPTSDAFVWFIARNQALLRDKFLFYCPDMELLSLFNDKSRTGELERFGLSVPFTISPRNIEELNLFINKGLFPAIVKPSISNNPDFPGKVIVARDNTELKAFFDDYPSLYGECVVQEFISGGDASTWEVFSFSCNERGIMATCILHKIRQYPPAMGISSFIRTEDEQRLRRITETVLARTGYNGLADWEFLYDRLKDKFYIIDINCRPGMPNQICPDAGVDLIGMAYDVLVGPNTIFSLSTQRNNVYYLNFEWDIGSFFRKKNAGEITWWQWLLSLLKARSFAFFSITDPLPFLIKAFSVSGLIVKKLYARIA